MPIETHAVIAAQVKKILDIEEGHFVDLKAIEVAPAKLTEFHSAFANSDGGELYIGIDEDKTTGTRTWRGFATQEHANGHLQVFEQLFPLGQHFAYTFLTNDSSPGTVLKIDVHKTADIKRASNGTPYIRRGAQKLPLKSSEEIKRLEYTKGITSFESELTTAPKEVVLDSYEITEFLVEVVPTAVPEVWLRKQQLMRNDHPTVAGVLLFADEPQAVLAKRCGLKIHRYRSTEKEGRRDTMAFDPITVEGSLYKQIRAAVDQTKTVIQEARTLGDEGFESIEYPPEALQEVITNAVVHRDYSIADDVHIRVFDNRVEVESPGRLPAHVTPDNILHERFARNGSLVRLLNKYPNPPNKDVGEGLNTTFRAMRKLGLREPRIENRDNSVLVALRHERLASREELVLEYLEAHETIKNKQARELCHIDADYKMRRIFGRLESQGLIEKVPGLVQAQTAYQKGPKFGTWRAVVRPTHAQPVDEDPDDGEVVDEEG